MADVLAHKPSSVQISHADCEDVDDLFKWQTFSAQVFISARFHMRMLIKLLMTLNVSSTSTLQLPVPCCKVTLMH